MKKWLLLILFIVSWKTQLPSGFCFWTVSEGFVTFYEATDFIDKLFVNPNIKEIRLKKEAK